MRFVDIQLVRTTLALAVAMAGAFGQATLGMTPSPLVPGGNADPHIVTFGDRYYLYSTGYNCFSSPDLVTWTRHGSPFDLRTLKWGEDTAWLNSIKPRTWTTKDPWAPAVVTRNGKYYFYFSADHYLGVAVADKPTGPFKDAAGKTLYNRWDGIDPMAFIDDDGEAYVFFGYGGQFGGMAVGILNPDMISWKVAPRIIAHNTNGLVNYLEGPFMFKRNGVYYLTYSNDNWQTPNYNLQYATASHPLGPYTHKGRFLEKDANHVGPGHHSVLQIPGRDQWYIVYHRYDNTQTTAGKTRTTHIDTLRFGADGSILPVKMTTTGVRGVNLAEVLKTSPIGNGSEVEGQRAGHRDLRLAARGGVLRLEPGAGAGRLTVLDARGAVDLRRDFRAGEGVETRLPGRGAYRAVAEAGGRVRQRALVALGD